MRLNGQSLPHRIGDLEKASLLTKSGTGLPHRIGDLEMLDSHRHQHQQLPHRIGDLETLFDYSPVETLASSPHR